MKGEMSKGDERWEARRRGQIRRKGQGGQNGREGGGVKWRKRAETRRYKSERERSHSNISLIVIHVHGYVIQLRLS